MQIILTYADLWVAITNVAGWLFGIITFVLAIILLIMGWANRKDDAAQFWVYVFFAIWAFSLLILLNR